MSMKIETIRLKNFKAFRDVELSEIPSVCVLVGAKGTGKSTLFNVFGFLKDALADNVHVALTKLGSSRGFQEVRSRGSTDPDILHSPSIELNKLTMGRYQKISGSRLIAPHLDLANTRSRSFVSLIRSLRRILLALGT